MCKKYDHNLKVYYYSIVRPLNKDEFESLKKSIKIHGVRVPIEYDENGAVLDGYHRLRACQELGIKKWPSLIRTGLSEEQKVKLARTLNYNRRHLTKEEKQQEALSLRKEGWTQAEISNALGVSQSIISIWLSDLGDPHDDTIEKKKQQVTDLLKKGLTQTEVSEKTGIPRTTISGWNDENIKINNSVIFSPSPKTVTQVKELYAADDEHALKAISIIKKGETNINKLHRRYKKALEKDKKRSLSEPKLDSPSIEIELGDFREKIKEIKDQSVDLIFTDPPYHKKHLSLWEDLALESLRTLKPEGFLLAYSGQNHLAQVFEILNRHLNYYWVAAVEHTHGQLRFWHKKVWNSWKPILIFSASQKPVPADWFLDLHRKGDKETKLYHDWEQPLEQAQYFIEHFCPSQGFVLDPMCGSGTIPLAAYLTDRKSLGIDVDPKAVYTARKRIKDTYLKS